MSDEQAIARYRYLLKTAPPETIEQAHAEAFAQLTPDQRRLVLQRMTETVPASERPLIEQASASPQTLARLATRQEMRQPGSMERMFGGQAGGVSMGGLIAGSLLSSIAGAMIGSAIAQHFFAGDHGAADPSQPDWESADADPGMGDGGDFDVGGGFDV